MSPCHHSNIAMARILVTAWMGLSWVMPFPLLAEKPLSSCQSPHLCQLAEEEVRPSNENPVPNLMLLHRQKN